MNFKNLFLLAISLVMVSQISLAQEPSIIPRPLKMEVGDGQFKITKSTKIYTDKAFVSEAKFLAYTLHKSTGIKLKPKTDKGKGISFIRVSKEQLGKEAYTLTVTPSAVKISASHHAGAFYAVQTLLQSLPAEVITGQKYTGELEVPAMKVKDKARFTWRAFMLDESRHFKGKEVVKQLLDQMASLKMNVFHWHLTDDQGWRIEIKKYPKLTSVGSKRKDTQVGGWRSKKRRGEPHSGFYTQAEIKEIVRYAAKRHITIVPEIGMPGHATAAVAAYPELGTLGTPIEVADYFGKLPTAYNAASEKVYTMLSEILDEVVALFPSKVIHIGGDEVDFKQWKNSKQVQAFMKAKGLRGPSDLQVYFTNRMSKIISDKGRRMMGWNEILGHDLHGQGEKAASEPLDKDAVIHFWKGNPRLAKEAIQKGHDVVNSTHQFTYLDYSYGSISLSKAYNFNPIFNGLAPEYHSKVKGFGCQMWSEWIPEVSDLHRQVFPRLAAYAEVGWTALDRKDFSSFKKRMEEQAERWDLLKIGYAEGTIAVTTAQDFFNHQKVTEWKAADIKSNFQDFTFDVSKFIKANGNYELAFIYKSGGFAIEIDSVTLFENGKKISQDKHIGFSGGQLKKVAYKLKVKNFKAGAKYQIKASIKGSGGTNSFGEIKITTK